MSESSFLERLVYPPPPPPFKLLYLHLDNESFLKKNSNDGAPPPRPNTSWIS